MEETPKPADRDRAASDALAPNALVPSLAAYRTTLLGQADQRFLDRRPVRLALAGLLAAALIVPSVQFVWKIQEVRPSKFRASGQVHRTALGRWIPTAELLTQKEIHQDPYRLGHWFPLPPLVLMSLAPLSLLSFTAAAIIWAALKLAGVIGVSVLLVKSLGRDRLAVPLGVVLLAAAFGLRPIVSDIQHGNVNVFVFAFLGLAWTMYLRRRDYWAGIFVALAIVTKLTPALVLLYFLYKRAWRVCTGALIGLLLAFVFIPGLYLGFDENFRLLHSWFDMLIAPFALKGYAVFEPENQSLYGVLLRIGHASGAIPLEEMPLGEKAVAGMLFMARPSDWWARLLRPAISLGLVGALAWACRSRCADRRDPRRLLEFGLVLLGALLLSERTWKHHGTTIAIVYLGVWYALTCLPWPRRFRVWFVAGLVVQWVLLVGSSVGLLGSGAADRLLTVGAFAWGWLLCFTQIVVMLRALRTRSRSLANVPIRVPDG